MKMKEKVVMAGNPPSESRGKLVKKASGCWAPSIFRRWSENGNLMIFLVYSLNVSGNVTGCSGELSEWPTQEHEGCLYMISCDFTEVCVKFSSVSVQGFRKRAV